jgi:hypothetical protein
MKLLLRRDQRSGMLGKVVFALEVRADLSPDEKANIAKYKLGSTMLYSKNALKEGPGNEYAQLGRAIMWRTLNLTITVNDLENGKRVECKDILEMLGAEDQIKEAAQAFKQILDAASHFGGQEVVEL